MKAWCGFNADFILGQFSFENLKVRSEKSALPQMNGTVISFDSKSIFLYRIGSVCRSPSSCKIEQLPTL
ncbi:unnamed protein product [Larinioides sclopetarius]|uniref:Uncharacterized protein n=1 Tax=Larinioides sclopetarius TaxID=280406 RepID=A0AAV2A230_9ARAC